VGLIDDFHIERVGYILYTNYYILYTNYYIHTDAVHFSDGRTVLYCPTFEFNSVSEASQDKERLQIMESIVIHWTRQIKGERVGLMGLMGLIDDFHIERVGLIDRCASAYVVCRMNV
jgi:hypothetical protein